MNVSFVALTLRGAELARRLAREFPGAEVHLPQGLGEEDGDLIFPESLREALPRLFGRSRALVCIMATGIVVRLLAPHLRGKGSDPAVVVMDEGGEYAISLLSGHLGGANDLAREIARVSGARAVITTATDVNGLTAWDEAARREGLIVEPIGHLRTLNALLLRGEPIALIDPERRVSQHFSMVPEVMPAPDFDAASSSGASGYVLVTHHLIPRIEENPNILLLRPRDLVVGIGCNRGTGVDEIEGAVRQVLQEASLSFKSIASVATIAEKADEEGLSEFARRFSFPLEYHDAEDLNEVPVASPPSCYALAALGAKGVCEPAAVLSAGGGALLVKKRKSGNVTVAVAEKG
jgi:cobalt-precorrin 5A hydrolase